MEHKTYKYVKNSSKSILFCLALIFFYIIISSVFKENPLFLRIINASDLFPTWASLIIYWFILLISLLLPLSSALLLVLLGIDLYGPISTFIIGLSAGIMASIISYYLGLKLSNIKKWPRFYDNLSSARYLINQHKGKIAFLILLSRAIPNPLYDIWGYAFGIVGIRFSTYLIMSTLGGLIALTFLCFLKCSI